MEYSIRFTGHVSRETARMPVTKVYSLVQAMLASGFDIDTNNTSY